MHKSVGQDCLGAQRMKVVETACKNDGRKQDKNLACRVPTRSGPGPVALQENHAGCAGRPLFLEP